MKEHVVSIAQDYSRFPGGRIPEDGPYCASVFRDDILLPAIKNAKSATACLFVDFDGTEGYGTSFLEETFGGLIRERGFTKMQIQEVLRFRSSREWVLRLVEKYINDAELKRLAKHGK